MRKYNHWWTYWVWTILFLVLSCRFMHRAITQDSIMNFIFGFCWIGIAMREIYWYVTDRKK